MILKNARPLLLTPLPQKIVARLFSPPFWHVILAAVILACHFGRLSFWHTVTLAPVILAYVTLAAAILAYFSVLPVRMAGFEVSQIDHEMSMGTDFRSCSRIGLCRQYDFPQFAVWNQPIEPQNRPVCFVVSSDSPGIDSFGGMT